MVGIKLEDDEVMFLRDFGTKPFQGDLNLERLS